MNLLELANMVIDLIGSSSELVFKPLPQDDPKQRQPDTSLAKELLNWKTNIPLQNGLKKTIEYFDCLLKEKYLYD
jgi:UDP-glucuronate decarboxylase